MCVKPLIDGIKDLERDAVRPAEQDTPMTRWGAVQLLNAQLLNAVEP